MKQTKLKMYTWSFRLCLRQVLRVVSSSQNGIRRLQSSFSDFRTHASHSTHISIDFDGLEYVEIVCMCKYDIHQHIWIWVWIHLNRHVVEFLYWKIKLKIWYRRAAIVSFFHFRLRIASMIKVETLAILLK